MDYLAAEKLGKFLGSRTATDCGSASVEEGN